MTEEKDTLPLAGEGLPASPDHIHFEVVHRRALEVLASTPMEGDYVANGLFGSELSEKMADPGEDFFLLDVRRREDYLAGHIEGAVHADFHLWAEPENLDQLPRDRKIVVLCYTGLAAAQVASGLRMLGYDAAVLKTGMNGWIRNGYTDEALEAIEAAAYQVRRVPPEPHEPGPADASFRHPDEEEFRIIAHLAREIFASTPLLEDFAYNTVDAGLLHHELSNGARGLYFILDLRREEDYEGVGHIEGSLQIDFTAVLVAENLEKLPRDRKIVVVCYTGNLAAQLVTALRMLGYDAVALNYGMVSWTATPTTRLYLKDIEHASNPVVSRKQTPSGSCKAPE